MSQFWRPRGDFSDTPGWDQQVPSKIKELAVRRGLQTWSEFQSWTQPRLNELRDPSGLRGMDLATDRLVKAFDGQEKVALYGDFDLDGTSALALLREAFSKLGFQHLALYQPSRLTEGYGFHSHAVEKLSQEGVTLIVTADVGITALAAAEKCKELGVDLIITDHHLPGAELPQALAVINPNQTECNSQLGHLCGVGVAFYLVWALRRKLVQKEKAKEADLNLKDLLDCFVIGTLTDMVPIRAENRVLVKHGLLQLAKTQRPGIRYLLEELSLLGRDLTSQEVAIRFAPKLNALSRMELNIRPLDLFLVESEIEAQKLMGQVLEQNDMRVTLQAEAEQLALTKAKAWEDKPFIFVYDESFHRGVIGLVATRLTQAFQKPSFVGSVSEEGIVVASARAPNGWAGNLVDVMGSASAYLHRFGGHSNAAGLEYAVAQVEDITRAFESHFLKFVLAKEQEPIFFDLDLEMEEITPEFMSWLDLLGPYGQTFEVPLFRIRGLEVLSVRELRGGHRRLEFRTDGSIKEGLLFGPTEQQLNLLGQHRQLDVLAEIQWNYFQNRKRLQLLIKEMGPPLVK